MRRSDWTDGRTDERTDGWAEGRRRGGGVGWHGRGIDRRCSRVGSSPAAAPDVRALIIYGGRLSQAVQAPLAPIAICGSIAPARRVRAAAIGCSVGYAAPTTRGPRKTLIMNSSFMPRAPGGGSSRVLDSLPVSVPGNLLKWNADLSWDSEAASRTQPCSQRRGDPLVPGRVYESV
jgi:hypothetical protein